MSNERKNNDSYKRQKQSIILSISFFPLFFIQKKVISQISLFLLENTIDKHENSRHGFA
jgi:hypothetical protein